MLTRSLGLRWTLRSYVELTKPRIVFLLVFTALGGFVVASRGHVDASAASLTLAAVTFGVSGSNALTCYIDRDIDTVMERTKRRPLPTGRVSPPEKALRYGLGLLALSLILSWAVNPVSSVLMFTGILDNVLVYSRLLKRRSPLNIVLGGFSGGFPALVGYSATGALVDLTAILMSALVVLWIPTHIWSLAVRWRRDYERARVPMLPVVTGVKKAVRCVASCSTLLAAFSLWLGYAAGFGWLYMAVAASMGAVMTLLSLRLALKPSEENAWLLFKFTSPYLAILFLVMMAETL